MLSGNVKPTHYKIFLEPNTALDAFQGRVEIAVEVAPNESSFSLHCAEQLRLTGAATLNEVSLQVSRAADVVTLSSSTALQSGVLSLSFEGPITSDSVGIYSSPSGKSAGVATQFFATYARRCFPCFDEPAKKGEIELDRSDL